MTEVALGKVRARQYYRVPVVDRVSLLLVYRTVHIYFGSSQMNKCSILYVLNVTRGKLAYLAAVLNPSSLRLGCTDSSF